MAEPGPSPATESKLAEPATLVTRDLGAPGFFLSTEVGSVEVSTTTLTGSPEGEATTCDATLADLCLFSLEEAEEAEDDEPSSRRLLLEALPDLSDIP